MPIFLLLLLVCLFSGGSGSSSRPRPARQPPLPQPPAPPRHQRLAPQLPALAPRPRLGPPPARNLLPGGNVSRPALMGQVRRQRWSPTPGSNEFGELED